MIRLRAIERMIYPLALLTSVIGVVYWYWTTTPNYALTQIILSVQNHDRQTFAKYVDVDTLAAHAFDDVVNGQAGQEIIGQTTMMQLRFLPMLKPAIIEIVRHKLEQIVMHGKIDQGVAVGGLASFIPGAALVWADQTVPNGPTLTQAKEAAGLSQQDIIELDTVGADGKEILRQYGLTRGGFRGVKYLTTNSGTALLGLQFYSPKLNQNWVAEFKLEDAGGFWRVTQLSNLNQLLAAYIRSTAPAGAPAEWEKARHNRPANRINFATQQAP